MLLTAFKTIKSIMDKLSSKDRNEHLSKLEALFGGSSNSSKTPIASTEVVNENKPIDSSVPKQVFSNPRKSAGRSPSEYRMRMERIKAARDIDQIIESVDVFLKHHQLPDDPSVLFKVMQHTNEKVIREALGQISSLLMQGRLNPTVLLTDRLEQLEESAVEESTLSYVHGIKNQIESMRKS